MLTPQQISINRLLILVTLFIWLLVSIKYFSYNHISLICAIIAAFIFYYYLMLFKYETINYPEQDVFGDKVLNQWGR